MDFESTLTHPLDVLQKQGIDSMTNNNSVFAAMPTGSGKTIFVEYAWYLSREAGTKMIYTAPLKAISNQKYSDFSRKFGEENVGIITGDVVVNEDADLLVMTTEILRALVFARDGRLNSVKWVVFDEIHYLNDPARGSARHNQRSAVPRPCRRQLLRHFIQEQRPYDKLTQFNNNFSTADRASPQLRSNSAGGSM